MKKTTSNLMLCGMVFAVALVISNVIAAKTIATGIPLFGGIVVPSAVLCYCITFLMTDVVGEIWGRKEAQQIVWFGFVCQLFATAIILIAQAMPAADASMQASFDMLLGSNAVFVCASLSGYLLSQSWDVFVFHKIRTRLLTSGKGKAWRWVWNNASTMTSQVIDTVVYITIAFGFGLGWLFDPAMSGQLVGMMVGQYLCKFCLAASDTPFFYLLTRRQADRDQQFPPENSAHAPLAT